MNVYPPPLQNKELQQIQKYKRLLKLEWAIEKKRCLDYKFFFRAAWPELEPTTPLVWNWHLDVLCNELQAQVERIAARKAKEYDILINVPPRTLKSTVVSRLLLPYAWTRFPSIKFLTISYERELALEHAVDSRSLILSNWYQRHWGNIFQMTGDQNVKSYYRNDHSGYRIASSVGSSNIGRGANIIIFDDPNDPKRGESIVGRQNVINWFKKVAYSRLNNQKIDLRIIIQQRTYDDDLTGYILQNFSGDWKQFCLPAEESDDILPVELRSFYKSGLLFPERLSKEIINDYRKNLGSDFSGQIQQRPAPPEGGMFKRQWWRFWRPRGMELPDVIIKSGNETFTCRTVDLPEKFEDKICSWDMGLKGKKDNDFSVGQAWGKTHVDYFVLDQARGLWDDLQQEEEARALKEKHPDSSICIIEDTAGGTSVILRLKSKISGVQGKIPVGDKKTRAKPLAALAQSGNVYLPHPAIAPWVWTFIDNYAEFDRGTYDDEIDAGSQAIDHFQRTRRVFSDYGGETTLFRLDWDNLERDTKIFIAQHVEKNLKSYLLVLTFNSREGILRVLADAFSETANPDAVIPTLRKILILIGADKIPLRRFSWFGNSIMVSKAHGDIAQQYLIQKIFVRDLPFYNDQGAVVKVIRLLSSKKLILHRRAQDTSKDVLSWTYKKDLPEEGYGFARALCLAAEAIRDDIRLRSKPKGFASYSKEKKRFLEKLDELARSGNLDRNYQNPVGSTKEKDYRMV